MKKKQLKWVIPSAIFLLLMVTNPSPSAFKYYIGAEHYSDFRRTHNWIIFSTYEYDNDTYVGTFLNFFKF